MENDAPWFDNIATNAIGYKMIFGHGITEITNIMYGTQYVYLPSTLTKIHAEIFHGDSYNPSAIYFEGTEEQWAAIEIGENNDNITNATIYFNQPKIII